MTIDSRKTPKKLITVIVTNEMLSNERAKRTPGVEAKKIDVTTRTSANNPDIELKLNKKDDNCFSIKEIRGH